MYDGFFTNPQTLNDDELEREHQAIHSHHLTDFLSADNVSASMKDELRRHAHNVDIEYKSRIY